MKFPLVTIMIPTYNQGDLIAKAISLALQQSYANLEIVISDDESSDKTKKIISSFLKDPRVTYHRHSQNVGRVANYRHLLYKMAHGEWVAMLDGDDYYVDKDFIKTGINKLLETKDSLFYQANKIVTSRRGLVVENQRSKTTVLSNTEYFTRFGKYGFGHMATIYHRELAIEAMFYEQDLISSDVYSVLNWCLKKSGNIILDTKITGAWYEHDRNESNNLDLVKQKENFNLYSNIVNRNQNNSFINKTTLAHWARKQKSDYLRGLIFRSARSDGAFYQTVKFAIREMPQLLMNLKFYYTILKSLQYLIKLKRR